MFHLHYYIFNQSNLALLYLIQVFKTHHIAFPFYFKFAIILFYAAYWLKVPHQTFYQSLSLGLTSSHYLYFQFILNLQFSTYSQQNYYIFHPTSQNFRLYQGLNIHEINYLQGYHFMTTPYQKFLLYTYLLEDLFPRGKRVSLEQT